MNFDYINNIAFPVFIIETKTKKIFYKNENMKNMKNLDIKNLAKTVAENIAINDTVTFSYNLMIDNIFQKLKIRAQYIQENQYIITIVYTDLENYIQSADLSIFTEIIPGGLMIVEVLSDKEYIAQYVNTGLLNMLGYTRKECEEYFSHDVLKFIYPDDIEKGLNDFYRQIKEKREFTLKGRLIRKDNTLLQVHFTGKLIKDISNKTWLYCTVTDITSTKYNLDDNYDSIVVINLTENKVISGNGLLFENKKIPRISANQYFEKINSLTVDYEEHFKKFLSRKSLIDAFFKNEFHFSFEIETLFSFESHWMKLDIELLENPVSKSVIALLKWKNINDINFKKRINKIILSYTHDLIWLIFTKTNNYMFIEHTEDKKDVMNKINHGYETFINNVIEGYTNKSDWNYLKTCFSIKNLKEQLSLSKTYSFIGHGFNLDGTPIVKLHQFSYFDRNKGIILYSRQDITNKAKQISFKINGVVFKFSYSEILFIESFGRKCDVITIKGSFLVNENISSIQSRLSGDEFIRCHRSYIVNINSIKKIEKNYAVLSNEKKIPINRPSIAMLKNKI